MLNPLANIKLIADEVLTDGSTDSQQVGIIEAMLFKFAIALLIVIVAYIYFDKTSVLNGKSAEENIKLHKMDYHKELREQIEKEEKQEGNRKEKKSTKSEKGKAVSSGKSSNGGVRSRKT
jgi:hypothetical protein